MPKTLETIPAASGVHVDANGTWGDPVTMRPDICQPLANESDVPWAMEELRRIRNAMLAVTDKVIASFENDPKFRDHPNHAGWIKYRQELRDLPAKGLPVSWPETPPEMEE